MDISKNFFMVRVVTHWNRLAREVADIPSLAAFKVRFKPGFEELDLEEGVPAHSRAVGLYNLQRSLPTQTIL